MSLYFSGRIQKRRMCLRKRDTSSLYCVCDVLGYTLKENLSLKV